jgi:hypothetical protein
MTDEQLALAGKIKERLKNLKGHKERVERALKNSRDQSQYSDNSLGRSEISISWSSSNSVDTVLRKEFTGIPDTTYLTIYLSNLDQEISKLETEFSKL